MRLRLPVATIAAALLLAACQAGTQNDGQAKRSVATGSPASGSPGSGSPAASPPASGSPAPSNSAERNAVAAFTRICDVLNRNTVVQRAAEFGFVPVRNDDMPATLRASLARTNGVMFIRPAGAPAMLLWSDPQVCELWVGGVQLPGLEEEFSQFLGRLSSNPNSRSAVTRLSPEQADRMRASDNSRLRQGALITPRELVAAPARVVLLRSPEPPEVFQALMIHRVATPPPGAPAATTARAGPPKDPVR